MPSWSAEVGATVKSLRSDAFRKAAEEQDFSRLEELFTDDVVFKSPVVYRPYQGREAMSVILGAVVRVFEGFRYLDQVETGQVAVLRFEARVGDREVDGVDILRFGPDGRAVELSVMVRPMSAMHALAARMQEMLEAAEHVER